MSKLTTTLSALAGRLGIDKAISYSAGSRIVSALAGVLTLYFVSAFLSEESQGFYFTFGSIVALQVFFELGLTNILTQYVAHEQAHIEELSGGAAPQKEESAKYESRLAHLLHFSVKWYLVAGILYFVIVLLAGFWFFRTYSPASDTGLWLGPWILVTAFSAGNMFLSMILAILKGVGKVAEISQIVFYQQLAMPLSIWVALMAGAGLYGVGVGYGVMFVAGLAGLLILRMHEDLRRIWRRSIREKVNYSKEIFPYQWRISLSWASGYFVFQFFNPVLFATSGPVAAGQMGMTLAALNGISAFASSWIDTKVPLLSKYIALKEYVKLDSDFRRVFYQLMGVCGFLLLLFVAVVEGLKLLDIGLGYRFLPVLPLCLMGGAVLANQAGNCWAVYLRCHKQEPLLVNSLVGAVLCGVSAIVCGNLWGAVGISAGYFLLRVVLSWWNYIVYKRKKREWHVPEAVSSAPAKHYGL